MPELLLQPSRAQLLAAFHHQPSKAAFSQPECLKWHTSCVIPGMLPNAASQGFTQTRDNLSTQPCVRETLVAALRWGCREHFSTQGQHTWGNKDLMSLSTLFPCLFLLVNISCSLNTVPNTKPKSSSLMRRIFPVPHYYRGDHSASCGCSAARVLLHGFLHKTWAVLSSRSCW